MPTMLPRSKKTPQPKRVTPAPKRVLKVKKVPEETQEAGPAKPKRRSLPPSKILTSDPDLIVKILTLWARPPFPSFGQIVKILQPEYPRLNKPAAVTIHRRALEKGLLTPHLNLPIEQTECRRLELALQNAFPLRVAKVVRVSPDGLDDAEPKVRERVRRDVLRRLVAVATTIVDAFIAGRAGPSGRPITTIGIGWGITMYRLMQHMASGRRPKVESPLEFVPVVAPSARPQEVGIDSNSLTMRMAELYGATAWGLNCPAFPRRIAAMSIDESEDVKPILRRVRKADLVVNSIAGVNYDASLSEDSRVIEELRFSDPRRTAVGRLGFWFWDERGYEVKLARRRPIGIGLQGMRTVARDPDRVALTVVGGDLSRGPAILGALRGLMITHLVTDDITARWLLAAVGG